MGLSPDSFERMTFAEFVYAQRGYMRRLELEYRTSMNIERWGTFAILSALVDMKGSTAYEVLPLPWDDADSNCVARRSPGRRISAQEMRRRRAEADEMIKMLEKNGQNDINSAH